MDVSTYYHYQTEARGHHSIADVVREAELKARLYGKLVAPWLPKARDAEIYEVACGAGIVLRWLKNLGYSHIQGSDSSEEQIRFARALELPAKLADSIEDLRSLPSGGIDCIIAFDFYEHLAKEVMLDFFTEAHRVLKPTGNLILRGPNGDSPVVGRALFNDITHQWALTTVAFRATLNMVGFHEVSFKDDALASIQRHRWVKVPLAWLAQIILRALIRSATREQLPCLSASMFLCAWK